MSLVKTLAKVAVGVAIAKGVNEVAKSRSGQGSILEGMKRSGTTSASSRGGLEGMLGQVLSGRGGAAAGGGLGGLLESLSKASRPQGGSTTQPDPAPRSGSLGDLLNQSFESYGEPATSPSRDDEDQAALLLRAMIMAAKADGRIDQTEQKRIMDRLEDATQEEMSFLQQQLNAPVDPQALAADTPSNRKAQVYLMSIMAIDIDSQAEVRYLRDLASALGLDTATVASIHQRLGVPSPA
jgi:uncharacterized membrane protein YebE (DUF533 family)